jgi:hypothetical protein
MAAKPSCLSFAEAADLNTHVADLIVHLGAKAADLIAYVGADVLAFFFDETRKLLELGLFILRHASQYTIVGASTTAMGFGDARRQSRRRICKKRRPLTQRWGSAASAKWDVILQASDLQGAGDGGACG